MQFARWVVVAVAFGSTPAFALTEKIVHEPLTRETVVVYPGRFSPPAELRLALWGGDPLHAWWRPTVLGLLRLNFTPELQRSVSGWSGSSREQSRSTLSVAR